MSVRRGKDFALQVGRLEWGKQSTPKGEGAAAVDKEELSPQRQFIKVGGRLRRRVVLDRKQSFQEGRRSARKKVGQLELEEGEHTILPGPNRLARNQSVDLWKISKAFRVQLRASGLM
ncbi:hypothetical protein HDU90_005660 [Geranomyces variabilis]|nr:hypothetical protein HDU90_005660 [Geranomyces variabilis]